MGSLNHVLLVGVLILPCTTFARDVAFDDLLRNPSRYNRQRVSVTGIAEVVGDDFELWRDEHAVKQMDLERDIRVVQDLNLPPYPGTNVSRYSPVNLHWVKITGMVDTTWHGRFGFDRFGLMLDRVQILPGPRLKQFLWDSIWLKNDTRHRLNINVSSKGGGMMSEIVPNEVFYDEIKPARVAHIDLSLDNKPFARFHFVPMFSRRYYDRDKRAYYFRISERKISLMPPGQAKGWKFGPLPWRD